MTLPKLRPTFTFDLERLDALRAIAPEAFADGKINWQTLREALGDHLEEEGRDAEHFGLFWPGKRAARRLASTPSAGTLLPAPGEGVNEATTRHLFIEGDNLEVLKLLQKSYAGRVKLIYIDPPYNTGNDFIYSDNFTQPLEEYLAATGQADEMGRVLVTNTRAGGRYHSNWLNMMYPRLRLARTLLREDGVIFVSIDDNEVHHLRALMNEVFGEENFIACMPWRGRGGRQASAFLAEIHEYIVMFARSAEELRVGSMPKEDDVYPKFDPTKQKRYKLQLLRKWGNAARRVDRPNLWFGIPAPDGTLVYPKLPDGTDGRWRWGRKAVEAALVNNDLEFVKATEGWVVYEKQYEPSPGESITQRFPTWLDDVGTTANGTQELHNLFGRSPFDYPKPVSLLMRLLRIAGSEPDSDDIVLDFFAGSCTTAHAVLQLNREDGGNRRFIMVQLPEPTPPDSQARRAGFATIADIGKERIRRVIARLQGERAGQLALSERETAEDLGFRVFKLGRSHYKAWQDYDGDDLDALQTLFDRFESPLVEGWRPENLLVEIMLMEGFPLDSAVEPLPEFPRNIVRRVSSDLVAHRLYVCLDERVHEETIAALALDADDLFICLDAALSDEAKVRLEDGRRVKVI